MNKATAQAAQAMQRAMKAAHRRTEQRIQAILQNRRQPHDIEVIDL